MGYRNLSEVGQPVLFLIGRKYYNTIGLYLGTNAFIADQLAK